MSHSGAYHEHNRAPSVKSHKKTPVPPEKDPAVQEHHEVVQDERYYRGGLETGGVKTTGSPKDTP